MKTLFTLLFTIIILGTTYSQSIFRDAGSSGFNLSAQFTAFQSANYFGLEPSYTLNGKLDVGLGLTLQTFDFVDATGTAFRPFVSYLLLKQGQNAPVSLRVGSSFEFLSISDFDLSATSSRLDGTLFYGIKASEKVRIIPGLGIVYSRNSFKEGGVTVDTASGVSYDFSIAVRISQFWIRPSLSTDNDTVALMASVGYTF